MTDKQTDRQADNRQTKKQTERHTDRQTERQKYRQTNIQKNRHTYKPPIIKKLVPCGCIVLGGGSAIAQSPSSNDAMTILQVKKY